jgi:leucyl-tRNA synthetase
MKQEEVEDIKLTREDCLKDAEKLKGMSVKEGLEYMANIQHEITRQLSNTAENVKQTLNQNKALISILNNAVIVMQRDFTNVVADETSDGEADCNLCFITGSNKQIKQLIKVLATQLPSVFEEVIKEMGYSK